MQDEHHEVFTQHPDLASVSDVMRAGWERVALAEQSAADAIRIRRRSLRDRLTEAANRTEWVLLHTQGGKSWRGRIDAVGSDHVLIGPRPVFVTLRSIVAFSVEDGPR